MNFAVFANCVFGRDADEAVPAFRDRVRDAAAELGGGVLTWGAPEALEWVEPAPEVIEIRGGLVEDSSADFAQFGDVLMEREEGELIEDFQRRAHSTAQAAGFGFVAFGGLPELEYDFAEEGED